MIHSSLRSKAIRVIAFSFIGVLFISGVLFFGPVQENFITLEQSVSDDAVRRAVDAFHSESTDFIQKVEDWAIWDDSYEFMENFNQSYIKSNLNLESAETLGVDSIVYLNKEYQPKLEKYYTPDFREGTSARNILPKLFGKDGVIAKKGKMEKSISGFFSTPEHTILLVASPILTSRRTGPSRGVIIFIKVFSSKLLLRLRSTIGHDLDIWPISSPMLPQDIRNNLPSLKDAPRKIVTETSNLIKGYGILNDLWDQPSAVIRLQAPRPIYKEEQRTVYLAGLVLALTSLFFASITIYFVEHYVLKRILLLSKEMKTLQESKDISRRLTMTGSDEIRDLATRINFMLSSLEDLYQEVRTNRDQVHTQALRFAEQVERLTTSREVSAKREGELRHLLKEILTQLQLLINETSTEPSNKLERLSLLILETEANLESFDRRKVNFLNDKSLLSSDHC